MIKKEFEKLLQDYADYTQDVRAYSMCVPRNGLPEAKKNLEKTREALLTFFDELTAERDRLDSELMDLLNGEGM